MNALTEAEREYLSPPAWPLEWKAILSAGLILLSSALLSSLATLEHCGPLGGAMKVRVLEGPHAGQEGSCFTKFPFGLRVQVNLPRHATDEPSWPGNTRACPSYWWYELEVTQPKL